MRTIEENKYKSLCVSSIYTYSFFFFIFASHTFNFIEIHTHCGHIAHIQLKNVFILRRSKHFICLFTTVRIPMETLLLLLMVFFLRCSHTVTCDFHLNIVTKFKFARCSLTSQHHYCAQ